MFFVDMIHIKIQMYVSYTIYIVTINNHHIIWGIMNVYYLMHRTFFFDNKLWHIAF